jgi:hypothetical protein
MSDTGGQEASMTSMKDGGDRLTPKAVDVPVKAGEVSPSVVETPYERIEIPRRIRKKADRA